MKNKLLLIAVLFVIMSGTAQKSTIGYGKNIQAGINFAIDLPNAKVMPFMNTAKGPEYSFLFKPVKKIPVWLSCNFGTGTYAKQTFSQQWHVPASAQSWGSATIDTTIMGNATYKSQFNKLFLGLRITRRDENARWQPYLNLRAGYVKFLSNVKVTGSVSQTKNVPAHYLAGSDMDADDWVPEHQETTTDHFKEKKQTYCCGSYVWSAGAGVQFRITDDLNNRNAVNSYFDFSINYIGGINEQGNGWDFFKGGTTCYTNDEYMKDLVPYSSTGDPSRDPNAGYVNVSPPSIAQKKVAKLVHSPISMFNISMGYTLRF